MCDGAVTSPAVAKLLVADRSTRQRSPAPANCFQHPTGTDACLPFGDLPIRGPGGSALPSTRESHVAVADRAAPSDVEVPRAIPELRWNVVRVIRLVVAAAPARSAQCF